MADENEGRYEESQNGDLDSSYEEVDNEYYKFLNVPRDASEQDINAAFKKLSRLYHPDKHLDPENKKKAETLFAKLKTAHEVLSDPQSRAIYDCLGKKGLKEKGWEVILRTKTPKEIRDEYEHLAKEREKRRFQDRTNPTSNFQMTINATGLFERYLYDEEFDDVINTGLASLEISQMSLHQTINCPISNSDNVVVSGNVGTANGIGSGSVGCTWRRVMSDKSWGEVDASVGNGSRFGGKYFKMLTNTAFVNMSGSIQLVNGGLSPGISISLGNMLSPKTTGYLTYSSNWIIEEADDAVALSEEQSGMCSMIVHNAEKWRFMCSFQLGIPYTFITMSALRKFQDARDNARIALKLGTFGIIFEYGVQKKIAQESTLGATMIIGMMTGVTLKIKVTRAHQTYVFPILLAEEIIPQPIFYGTITPLILWYTVKKLVIDPIESRKQKKEQQKNLEAKRTKIIEAKKEALASIDLMAQRYSRIRNAEHEKGGLVIIVALYGRLVTDAEGLIVKRELDRLQSPEDVTKEVMEELLSLRDEIIDVTVPVQCLVEDNSRISIFEGSKIDLVGFYNPTTTQETQDLKLLVRYFYQNALHQVIINDDEAVKLPKTTHKVR